MFRYLVVPVLMALLLVPDWASALGRRRPLFAGRAQPISTPYYPVQYAQPVYYPAPPPPVYYSQAAPCCPPACQAAPMGAPSNPMVVPERMDPTPKPKGNVQSEPQAQPKAVEGESSLRPAAAASETLPPTKVPFPVAPASKPKEPVFVPVVPKSPEVAPLPALPKLKPDTDPKKDEPKPEDLPKLEFNKLDAIPGPPLAAPAPLESLTIPTVAKSSPLYAETGKPTIERFAVEGTAPASPDALRLVTFYNFSARELTLTIAGRAVPVPSKHRVEAKLPTSFAWKVGDDAQPEGTIPLTAPGLDIVIGK